MLKTTALSVRDLRRLLSFQNMFFEGELFEISDFFYFFVTRLMEIFKRAQFYQVF